MWREVWHCIIAFIWSKLILFQSQSLFAFYTFVGTFPISNSRFNDLLIFFGLKFSAQYDYISHDLVITLDLNIIMIMPGWRHFYFHIRIDGKNLSMMFQEISGWRNGTGLYRPSKNGLFLGSWWTDRSEDFFIGSSTLIPTIFWSISDCGDTCFGAK